MRWESGVIESSAWRRHRASRDRALIAPLKDGWTLQLRVANSRRTLLVEFEARVLLVLADPKQHDQLDY